MTMKNKKSTSNYLLLILLILSFHISKFAVSQNIDKGSLNFRYQTWSASIDSIKKLNTDTVTFVFHFTNTGKKGVNIMDVIPSCSCTIGDFTKMTIFPKQKGIIKLKTTFTSLQDKRKIYATVKSDASNDYIALKVLPY
jgi:hypothetical protein